ncbi:MAG: YgaP family membrane protein [Candidatus Nanopelagicales bacterium]
MLTNEGTADRVARSIAGVVAVVVALLVGIGSVLGIVLGIVGVVLLVTAAVGFCPIYRVFGLSTCPVKQH